MNDKDALAKWKDYDQSFSDPMDDTEVEDYDDLKNDAVPKNEWGRYGEYELVGNGEVTNQNCGRFKGYEGCLNVDLHGHVSLDGVNHTGNVYVRKLFYSCDKPTCPVCYKSGWAVREAAAIESRINEASKRFGLAEHIIASVPETDFGLTFKQLRSKIVRVLRSRGILGGVFIFHAFRYRNFNEAWRDNVPMGWYWSPHFHVIGFIDGGYGCCRNCKNSRLDFSRNTHILDFNVCLACKTGFEGRQRRSFLKEGGRFGKMGGGSAYIVKVMALRKTIHGTAWYQLNHCTIVRGNSEKGSKIRAHASTWFGVCSYTKLKLKKEDRVNRGVCPICGHELEHLVYVGDADNDPKLTFWIKEWEEPYKDKDGLPKWIPKPKVSRD